MPTYKNTGEIRILEQGLQFLPGQERTTYKVLAELELVYENLSASIGTTEVVGTLSAATGTILRRDDSINKLYLINVSDTPVFINGEEITMGAVTADVVSIKTVLKRTSNVPNYNPVKKLDTLSGTAGQSVSVVVPEGVEATKICPPTAGEVTVYINSALNVPNVGKVLAGDTDPLVIPICEYISLIVVYFSGNAQCNVAHYGSITDANYFGCPVITP